MEEKSKVYVLPDEYGRITRIDGGYTIGNISDFSGWVLIDEGTGDRYNLCQSNYLPEPLMDERGVYRYKLIDGEIFERAKDAMDDDYQQMIEEAETMREPTAEERIEAQVMYTALMTDTLLVEEE